MPTYGYECLGCTRSFETVQKMADDPLTVCDDCGGVLKRKVFPVGVVFKGTGFYVNDYAKKAAAAEEAPAAKSDAPPSDSAAAPTAASDPAAKPAEPAPASPAASAPAPAASTASTK